MPALPASIFKTSEAYTMTVSLGRDTFRTVSLKISWQDHYNVKAYRFSEATFEIML